MSRNKKVKNFKQYDSRWARVPFPKSPYFVSDSGCGPTAIADLIVTNPKYKKKTPKNTANWLAKRGYATYGDGTAWAGITACLKAYGFKVTQHDDMASFWAEMKKPGRMAIISFRGGTRGGVTWTLGGHFLACSGMEIKNGKHRLYMLDPGPRAHNGWYTYEKHMRGLIAQLWTCYLPEQKKEKKVENVAVKSIPQLVDYAKKRAKEKHKYKNSGPHSWSTTVNCTYFVGRVFRDCGYTDIAARILKSKYWRKPWGKKFLGPYLVAKAKSGKELTESQLKPGDIVIKKTKTANVYHSGIYVGNNQVAEAVGSGTRLGPLKGRHYIMAFRIPDRSPKPEPKTVEHVAKYEVTAKEGRNVKKKATSDSKLIIRIAKGAKFYSDKKKGNWVHGYTKIYGWINIRSKGKDHAKRIK